MAVKVFDKRRVLIVGCPGAGKSTFGRKLSRLTGLPLYYLDMIWHRADRTTVDFEEFDDRLEEILERPSWIIDGNYQRTLPMRMMYADIIFFFDLPMEVCLEGAVKRLGEERPDMPWHDAELSEEFREWIINFPKDRLPILKAQLAQFANGPVISFTSREEADEFLNNIRIKE